MADTYKLSKTGAEIDQMLGSVDVAISGSGDNKTTTITSVEHNLIIVGDVPEYSNGGDISIITDNGGAIHLNSTYISQIDMTVDGISVSAPDLDVNTGGVSIESGSVMSLGASDGISISTGGGVSISSGGQALYNNKEIAVKDDTQPKEYTFNIALDTSNDYTIYDTQVYINPSRPLYIQMVDSPELMLGVTSSISLEPFSTTVDDNIIIFVSKLGGFASSRFQYYNGNYIMWLQDNSVDLSKTLKLYFSSYSPEEDSVIIKIIN